MWSKDVGTIPVGRGASRKLHCPWVGPYQVVKRLSAALYRIQDVRHGRRSRQVVHFDRLKPCPPEVRFPPNDAVPKKQAATKQTQSHTCSFSTTMKTKNLSWPMNRRHSFQEKLLLKLTALISLVRRHLFQEKLLLKLTALIGR